MIDILSVLADKIDADSSITFPTRIGMMAAEPDDLIGLYYLPGDNPVQFFGASLQDKRIYHPRVKIEIRGSSYEKAYQEACKVKALLQAPIVTDSFGIFQENDLNPLGQDVNRRTSFDIRFKTIISE